ncbi:MAG: hypothetical protein EHM40_03430 [Chloroflexi bacterium]|nr:MAG: hypothetical protein EHM40_03430 [Chloroflexota bacterium]
MANINETLMTPDKLKSNMMDGAFGKAPHKFYAVYDDLMDEFIFKLTQPDTLVAEFPISDSFALLVEPTTFEVVGFQLGDFTKEYLPKMEHLNKIWDKHNLPEVFSTYKEVKYNPKDMPTPPKQESFFFFRTEKIDRVLATA